MLRDLLWMQRARYRASCAAGLVLPPNPTSMSPSTGPVGGGTTVTFRGNHLGGTTAVTFGGVAATSITNVSDGQITCVTPVGSLGPAVDVAVTTRAGTAVLSAAFMFTGAAPTFTSVANSIGTAVGDIDGGYTVTIIGTNLVNGGTSVTFGGVAATSVVVTGTTSLTCTVPAHASGQVNIVITTAGGSATAVNAWEYFSIAQLAASGYWRADSTEYDGAPWAATASAGASGATGALAAPGSAPTTGTALNGRTPAHFDGVGTYFLNGTTALGTIWTAAAGGVIALLKVNSTVAETGLIYDDPALLRDDNADAGITITSSGARMMVYDGAYKYATKAISTGAYHLVMGRWDSSNVGISVDNAAEVTTAAGASAVMSGSLDVGNGYGGGYVAMDLVELATFAFAPSNADYQKIRAYMATRHGVSV